MLLMMRIVGIVCVLLLVAALAVVKGAFQEITAAILFLSVVVSLGFIGVLQALAKEKG